MKRGLFCCLLLVLLLLSCQSQVPETGELMDALLTEYRHFPPAKIVYDSEAIPGEQSYMSLRLRSLLYDEGREREIPEFLAVKEYSVYLSEGIFGMEIHIFRMESRSHARNMAKLLERRAECMKRRSLYLYAPDAYENYLSSAAVFVKENFVFLLSTGQNDEVFSFLCQRID